MFNVAKDMDVTFMKILKLRRIFFLNPKGKLPSKYNEVSIILSPSYSQSPIYLSM